MLFSYHLSSKAFPASFNGGKVFCFPSESTFLNCVHMSAAEIKITGRFESGFISS